MVFQPLADVLRGALAPGWVLLIFNGGENRGFWYHFTYKSRSTESGPLVDKVISSAF